MDGSSAESATSALAARLRRAWEDSGLSLMEVARRSGVISDHSYLSRAFSGRQTLSPSTLEAVARVLKLDYRGLLAEAGFDERTYRSRHTRRSAPSAASGRAREPVRALLLRELRQVRSLKASGRPEEARGAIGMLERLLKEHLGGLPRDRETARTWAALLCERAGIVQDIQMPESVRHWAEPDLRAVAAIAAEYDARDLAAVGHFYAGDVSLKANDFAGAVPHYAWCFAHAPAPALRVRSLAGWAIALAHLHRPGDEAVFETLRKRLTALLSVEQAETPPGNVWDAEGCLLAGLWSRATLARSLVLLGRRREAEQEIEELGGRYDRATTVGFVHAPFAMSLAQLRFLAACVGVFDLSERDIQSLGLTAYRLADDGCCLRTKREVEDAMSRRFGFQAWRRGGAAGMSAVEGL